MTEENVTKALLKAILELTDKCDTIEELRESVKRIMDEPSKKRENQKKERIRREERRSVRQKSKMGSLVIPYCRRQYSLSGQL